jgi:hypothetical protein
MTIYPYRTIKSGQFTKYLISIVENGSVLVEYYFRNKCKSQLTFASQNEVDESKLPKIIKVSARWACYESKSLVNI